MKIAILVSLYPPRWTGGTEIATKTLVDKLILRGHSVDVITCEKEGSTKMLNYISQGTKKLKKGEYDIIHCQSIFPALIPYLLKKEYIIYCRGSDVMLTEGWMKRLNKQLLHNAKVVIALTKAMQDKLMSDYNVQSTIIPNAIDTFNCMLPRVENQIIFIGTLKKVKGINFLIDAIKRLPDMKLIIIGDGPERKELEKSAPTNVTFVGMLDQEMIKKYVCESQLLVLPSLSEGFSMSLLEAMAGGLPIIATKVGGNPEIIREGVNGCLVDPSNSEQIVEKIAYLLLNKEIWESISKNNLEEVKKYSWENVINRLEEVWKWK